MWRTWLRGRENVHKRHLIHVAGHNLGLLMRSLVGVGNPKEAIARGWGFIPLLATGNDAIILLVITTNDSPAFF